MSVSSSKLLFSKFKNKDFTKTKGYNLKQINESELAFLCFYNKTIPKEFCPNKNWKYKRNSKESFIYTFIERLQYNIFLTLNGYSILPLSYFYGLLMSIGLFINKNKYIQNKKQSTKSDSQIKESKITSHLNYRTHIKSKTIHKQDVNALLQLFDELNGKEKFSWNELNDLPVFIEYESKVFTKK